MIGYYIHHHGFGHLARASSICAQLRRPVTALTSLNIEGAHPFSAIVKLPRDDHAEEVREPTAHGALHWAPHHDAGFSARMSAIAHWVADAQPEVVVVDVSVEVAMFVRLLGTPVVVVALPGKRTDAPHLLVHRIADHILAAWPKALCVPAWLKQYDDKTSYVGGISRFEGRRDDLKSTDDGRVLVLGGTGGDFGSGCGSSIPGWTWTALGGSNGSWKDDPWPEIRAADVVVTHAGQSCVADIAAAQRPAIVIPQARPFDEQQATAVMLRRHQLAVVAQDWPDERAWPALLTHARARNPQRWQRWQVAGAAQRAAAAIESTALRCRARAR